MNIYLGADHGGFELKEHIKQFLNQQGYSVVDCGALELNPSDDYPEYGFVVGEKVMADPGSLGIVSCRSAGGIVTAANKVDGIRAMMAHTPAEAKHARNDDDAQILGLAADFIDKTQLEAIVETFINTPFSGQERHLRRINQLKDYEHLSRHPN